MEIFGLILSVIFIILNTFPLGFFIVAFFMKKYDLANKSLFISFLSSLIVIMSLSWFFVMINGGFNAQLFVRFDFTYLLIPVIPIFVIVEVLDHLLRRKIEQKSILYSVCRFLLPTLTVIVFSVGLGLLFFNISYFNFMY